MDAQLPSAQGGAVVVGDGDGVAVGGRVVVDGHGHQPIPDGGHPAVLLGAVGEGDGQAVAHAQIRLGLNLHLHQPVQGQEHQRAVFIDHIGDIIPRLGVNLLHPPGSGGGDGGAGAGLALGFQVVVQLVHHVLKLGDGSGHGGLIHRGQGVPGRNIVAVLHMVGLHRDHGGHGDGGGRCRFQGPGARDHGGNLCGLRRLGQHLLLNGDGAVSGRGGQGRDDQGDHQGQAHRDDPEGPLPPGRGVLRFRGGGLLLRLLRFQRRQALFPQAQQEEQADPVPCQADQRHWDPESPQDGQKARALLALHLGHGGAVAHFHLGEVGALRHGEAARGLIAAALGKVLLRALLHGGHGKVAALVKLAPAAGEAGGLLAGRGGERQVHQIPHQGQGEKHHQDDTGQLALAPFCLLVLFFHMRSPP